MAYEANLAQLKDEALRVVPETMTCAGAVEKFPSLSHTRSRVAFRSAASAINGGRALGLSGALTARYHRTPPAVFPAPEVYERLYGQWSSLRRRAETRN